MTTPTPGTGLKTERQLAQQQDDGRIEDAIADFRQKLNRMRRQDGWGTISLAVTVAAGRVPKGGAAVTEMETR